MYSRKIEGEVKSFGVSGKLWHGVLVMYDRETESYWTQLDGRSIQGVEQGKRLEHVPSTFTTFGQWVDAHPDSLVLAKTGAAQAGSRYADYYADPDRLFLPHLSSGLGNEIDAKDVIFGVRVGDDALAVHQELLTAEGIVNATVGGEPVAILRNGDSGEVRAVIRRLGGLTLTLEPASGAAPTEKARDVESGEVIRTRDLPSVRVNRSFWYAWKRTIPSTRVLTP